MLYNGDNNSTFFVGLLLELCYLMHFGHLVELLAHDEFSINIIVIIKTNVYKVFCKYQRMSN